jgi:formate hydrogenlyase subunit 6/NADH:ubiquinone oxidoreductase subunit I
MSELKEIKVADIKKEAEERRCSVQKAMYYIEKYLADPMCGKCFPCSFGSYEIKARLKEIISGRGKEDDIGLLKRIAESLLISSRCKKGKDTGEFILEWINKDDFFKHIEKICPERECLDYIEYRIDPDKCIMCGECKIVCKFNAIVGEKRKPYLSGYRPFEIRQKRCTKCGECLKACPTEAIMVVDMKENIEVEV